MDNDMLIVMTVMVTSTVITITALFVFQDVLMIAEDGAGGNFHPSSDSSFTTSAGVSESSHAVTTATNALSMVQNGTSEETDDLILMEAQDDDEDVDDGVDVDEEMENLGDTFIHGDVGVGGHLIAPQPGHSQATVIETPEQPSSVTTTLFYNGQPTSISHGPGETSSSIRQRPPATLIRRDSSQSEDHGMTCLHYFSITDRPPEDFEHVILANSRRQLNVNARVRYLHLSALHFAAMNASIEAMETLRKHGAHVNAQDALGKTPLRHAMMLRRAEIVSYLLAEAGARDRPDIYGCSALRYGLLKADVDCVRAYIMARPEAVNAAMEGGCSDRQDPGHHPLHVAAYSGVKDTISLLLDFGAETDGRDALNRTPLMYAAIQGHVDAAILLLNNGEVPQVSNSEEDQIDKDDILDGRTLNLLFRPPKANINALDSFGWSPIHYAAAGTKESSVECTRFLIEQGGNVNVCAIRYNLTPLHIAAKTGLTQMVSALLELGASPTTLTTDNRSALHFAAHGGHVDCVKILLAYTISLPKCLPMPSKNEEETPTYSPLHLAIRCTKKKESEEIVQLLIENRANIRELVPIEVEGWISWGMLMGKDSKKKKKKSVDPATGIEREVSIVKVSPITFAMAAGHLDVAKMLLVQTGIVWNMGLSQFILCISVALGSRRFDLAWRLVLKTPVGILVTILFMLVVFVRFAIMTTPPVTPALMKEAWEVCLKRRGLVSKGMLRGLERASVDVDGACSGRHAKGVLGG
ncbi:Ankyrin repeat domain-containing protein 16 [Phlyctochytrium planicorne]|nr:Ankyrin repeat domain-containing protein 16 [Phlyctochytrium planicorne]